MTIKYAKKGSEIAVFPMGKITSGYEEISKEEYDVLFAEKNKPSIAELIAAQQKILDDSDYKAIKAFEIGVPMEEELKQERQAARNEINRLLELQQTQN